MDDKDVNKLTKKLGKLITKLEDERDRHSAAIQQIAIGLDSLYEAFGAEVAGEFDHA